MGGGDGLFAKPNRVPACLLLIKKDNICMYSYFQKIFKNCFRREIAFDTEIFKSVFIPLVHLSCLMIKHLWSHVLVWLG